ncbi:MAG: hypothetical protein QM538_00900 [Methylacidiphilales bacterium]|nr:hypothetical protein [Candidatus Methylacidiphilales bacterium]
MQSKLNGYYLQPTITIGVLANNVSDIKILSKIYSSFGKCLVVNSKKPSNIFNKTICSCDIIIIDLDYILDQDTIKKAIDFIEYKNIHTMVIFKIKGSLLLGKYNYYLVNTKPTIISIPAINDFISYSSYRELFKQKLKTQTPCYLTKREIDYIKAYIKCSGNNKLIAQSLSILPKVAYFYKTKIIQKFNNSPIDEVIEKIHILNCVLK